MGNIPTPKMPLRPKATAAAENAGAETPEKANLDDLFANETETVRRGQFIILAGKGGTGKTTATLTKPGKTLFVDLEGSYGLIRERAAQLAPDVEAKAFQFKFSDDPSNDYERICRLIEADGYDGYDTVVLDSWSVVQKLLKEYTFRHELYKGKVCGCSDDYGYSTFPIYAYKGFARIFNAILKHVRAGRDFIVIAHAVDETVPDAALNDMKQWQFDAFVMKTGKESIRHDLFNNADQVWFMDDGAHASTAKDDKGKAKAGCRMAYFIGTGTIMAKSRTYSGEAAMLIPDGETIPWNEILNR